MAEKKCTHAHWRQCVKAELYLRNTSFSLYLGDSDVIGEDCILWCGLCVVQIMMSVASIRSKDFVSTFVSIRCLAISVDVSSAFNCNRTWQPAHPSDLSLSVSVRDSWLIITIHYSNKAVATTQHNITLNIIKAEKNLKCKNMYKRTKSIDKTVCE